VLLALFSTSFLRAGWCETTKRGALATTTGEQAALHFSLVHCHEVSWALVELSGLAAPTTRSPQAGTVTSRRRTDVLAAAGRATSSTNVRRWRGASRQAVSVVDRGPSTKARCGGAGGPGGIPLASCRQHARCN
jgi:hypothetical protein